MTSFEKRILVVDDDDAIRALLVTIFRRRGLAVDEARNGLDAAAQCLNCRYALVLLDLMMPEMNGWDLLAQMEEWPEPLRPLVIVLTAGQEPTDVNPSIVAGTVSKPFDVQLLMDMTMACLSTRPETEQLDTCPPPVRTIRSDRRR